MGDNITVVFLALSILIVGLASFEESNYKGAKTQPEQQWKIHDIDRPLPPAVNPGPAGNPVPAPADAIVLFDGKNLSGWSGSKGEPAKWKVEQGYMEVVSKAGSIRTIRSFGDCQLHLEWAAPLPAGGEGQGRGNSGVFLMDTYEIQVLDCYNNTTYADGMAASVYGQYPPLVNACRPPGEWQTYDIIFHRPHFDKDGKLFQPAFITMFHNGVLVLDNVELLGPTAHKIRLPYKAHPDKLPLSLQDHGNPVRYRNIWIRELGENWHPA